MRVHKIPRSWFIASTLGAFVALGCAEETGKLTTELELEPVQMLVGVQDVNLGPALAAQARHTPALMRLDGVVGTGVGLDENGEPAIKVFTLTAGVRGIPDRVDGVSVRRVVTGMFVAGEAIDPTDYARPAPNGFSIGHPDITAGTMGAIVDDGTKCYILSNNHVLANSNQAFPGDPSLQPGPFDGGTDPADAIGSLAAFKLIDFNGGDNDIDAAISAIFSTADVTAATPDPDPDPDADPDEGAYGAPGTSLVTAVFGQSVQKFGRTTGLTKGSVSAVGVTVNVCYQTQGPFRCKKLARFEHQFMVTPGTFSAGGDSGSLIVTNDDDANPIGLLFAGSSSHTIANPIQNVLDYFGVAIQSDLTNCGSSPPPSPSNSPPTAAFTYTTTDLTATFTDTSTDSDGTTTIATWNWDFGDENTSTDQHPFHEYGVTGTYPVTLTVTDGDGATGNTSQDVTVSDPGGDFTLSAAGYKVRGLPKADLEWSGVSGTGTNVDVWRNGGFITTTANDGVHTDNIDIRGGGSYTYKVCETGTPTPTCSNEATVTF